MSYCLLDGEAEQLYCVVRTGHVSDLQMLLDTGLDINATDQNGETALHTAVHEEKEAMVQELLHRGANPDVQNQNGQTPLHLAALNGCDELVPILVKAGADKDVKTKYSEMTALHLASLNSHMWIVTYLLVHGADSTILDLINKPPEFYAPTQDIKKLFQDHTNSKQRGTTQEYEFDSDTEQRENISTNDEDSIAQMEDISAKKKFAKKLTKDPSQQNLNQKMEFSERHKRRMQLSVFDRLTRSKSKIDKK